MKILTTMGFVLILGMFSTTVSHAASGVDVPLGLHNSTDIVRAQPSATITLAQQTKKSGEPEQQSRPDEHENMPGCRYQGGEDLQLLV